jgi:glucuronosyltransferase
LEEFVNSSKDGFIVFSLGSYLLMDDMPEEMLQSFIRTFSKLPQKVIWQWKGKPRSDFPKNILTISWLPQQDLMGMSFIIYMKR